MNKECYDHKGNLYPSISDMCKAYSLTIFQYNNRSRQGWDKEKILTTPVKKLRKDHTGEKHINNDGLEFEILSSPDSHHITIQFIQSGNIRENIYYADIIRGMVKDRIDPDSHVGESKIMKCGKKATIIEFLGHSQYKILLDNGKEFISQYYRFVNGEIGDTTHRQPLLGLKSRAKNGEEFEVIDETKDKCTVRFSNGVVKEYNRHTVRAKTIASGIYKKPLKEYNGVKLPGNIITSIGGKNYKITKCYDRGRYVDVIDEEGKEIIHIKPQALRNRRETNRGKVIREKNRVRKQLQIQEVIGQKSITSSLNECSIVSGRSLSDLDVQLNDGTILYHKTYHAFLNGCISEKSAADTTISRNRNKMLGIKKLQKCGLYATCIEYINCDDITVEFSTGEKIKTSVFRFNHGFATAPSVSDCRSSSFNEFTILYCLEGLGFVKMPRGSLRKLEGFKNMELDLYNPEHKIAIEYDGAPHKNEQCQKRDRKKDALCKKHGIHIIRVREKGVPLLSDNISEEYRLDDTHHFSPALRNCIKKLTNDICSKYKIAYDLPDLTDISVKDTITKRFAEQGGYASHINETNINNQGENMTIFEYYGHTDIGVIFDNGYITRHRTYQDFKRGRILCKQKHFGEIYETKGGDILTIISHEYGSIVDVEFDDGTILRNVSYSKVKNGQLGNPNRRTNIDKSHIGECVMSKCGLLAEIVTVRRDHKRKNSELRVIARFEDGEYSNETSYCHFKQGYLKHPA